MLELGEYLLDRIEVGAVERKKQQTGTCASDCRVHSFGFVAAGIIDDDDAAAAERRDQLRIDVDLKALLLTDPSRIQRASIRSCRRETVLACSRRGQATK